MAEVKIGVHRVQAVLLQLVGFDFLHKSYAAALLVEVYDGSPALFLYHLHGQMKLFAAFTSHRAEDVARSAGGMHPDQYWLAIRHVPFIRAICSRLLSFGGTE